MATSQPTQDSRFTPTRPPRGTCPRCGGMPRLTREGLLPRHPHLMRRGAACEGSGQPPMPEAAVIVRQVAR